MSRHSLAGILPGLSDLSARMLSQPSSSVVSNFSTSAAAAGRLLAIGQEQALLHVHVQRSERTADLAAPLMIQRVPQLADIISKAS